MSELRKAWMREISDEILREIIPDVAEATGLTSAFYVSSYTDGRDTAIMREAVVAFNGGNQLGGFGLRLLADKYKNEITTAVANALERRGIELLDRGQSDLVQQVSERQHNERVEVLDGMMGAITWQP